MKITIKPTDFQMTLGECPPGLFLHGETLGFKSEYGATEAFVAESGEYFWGGAKTDDDRDRLLVIPCGYVVEP